MDRLQAEKTSVLIYKTTRNRLRRQRLTRPDRRNGTETFDDVINRLIDCWEEAHGVM